MFSQHSQSSHGSSQDPFKSRYRGVYRCGRRWKAQLQSHGIQFYLGMFDTEEDAARAYDRKAREEKGSKNPINFENTETEYQVRPSSPSYRYFGGTEEDDMDIPFNTKNLHDERSRYMTINHAHSNATNGSIVNQQQQQQSVSQLQRLDYQATTENMKILWDRHCQIAQRILLAKATQAKLLELHSVAPDTEKETILKALSEEIVLLVVVKAQLEESVSRCFRLGLDLNASCLQNNDANHASSSTTGSDARSSHLQHPLYQQDRRNGEMAMLPSFGANFHHSNQAPFPMPSHANRTNGMSVGGSSGGLQSGQLPMRMPYGAPSAGYFGQTYPPNALPALSLPSRSMPPPPHSMNIQQVPPAMQVPTHHHQQQQARPAVSVPNAVFNANASSGVAPPSNGTQYSSSTTAGHTMSSFTALTKGPSLLGNTSLLTEAAAVSAHSRLPPPPPQLLPPASASTSSSLLGYPGGTNNIGGPYTAPASITVNNGVASTMPRVDNTFGSGNANYNNANYQNTYTTQNQYVGNGSGGNVNNNPNTSSYTTGSAPQRAPMPHKPYPFTPRPLPLPLPLSHGLGGQGGGVPLQPKAAAIAAVLAKHTVGGSGNKMLPFNSSSVANNNVNKGPYNKQITVDSSTVLPTSTGSSSSVGIDNVNSNKRSLSVMESTDKVNSSIITTHTNNATALNISSAGAGAVSAKAVTSGSIEIDAAARGGTVSVTASTSAAATKPATVTAPTVTTTTVNILSSKGKKILEAPDPPISRRTITTSTVATNKEDNNKDGSKDNSKDGSKDGSKVGSKVGSKDNNKDGSKESNKDSKGAEVAPRRVSSRR